MPVRLALWRFLWSVTHGPSRGVDSWLHGHDGPPVNSGHQTQDHSRQVVSPSPDICPQHSLEGRFATGHPEGDNRSSVAGPFIAEMDRWATGPCAVHAHLFVINSGHSIFASLRQRHF